MKGPFFPPEVVLHGSLSILAPCSPPNPVVAEAVEVDGLLREVTAAVDDPEPTGLLVDRGAPPAGLGSRGRNLDAALPDVPDDEAGEDLDEVVECGEIAAAEGEGVVIGGGEMVLKGSRGSDG